MDVEYIHRGPFGIIGFTRIIDPRNSSSECGKFWKECYHDRFADLFRTGVPTDEDEEAVVRNNIGRYGVFISTCNDMAEYMIGGDFDEGNIPEGMKVLRIPEGNWAVFREKGPVSETVESLHGRIWNEWYPSKGIFCTPCGDNIITVYNSEDIGSDEYPCEIWVQVLRFPGN